MQVIKPITKAISWGSIIAYIIEKEACVNRPSPNLIIIL
jgi:hypothetical protein